MSDYTVVSKTDLPRMHSISVSLGLEPLVFALCHANGSTTRRDDPSQPTLLVRGPSTLLTFLTAIERVAARRALLEFQNGLLAVLTSSA